MAVLSIRKLAMHQQDTVLFPAFDLNICESNVVAIYSNLNVRHVLMSMFTGKTAIVSGEININSLSYLENKVAYLTNVGFSFFEEGLYERLTIKDHFKFYKKLYDSKRSIDNVLSILQLGKHKNTRIERLSFSEMKRIQFARLLFQDPILYVFEEPDLNIDMETKHIFLNMVISLQEKGMSVLILTGNMESAITASDYVYRLDESGLNVIEIDKMENEAHIDTLDEHPIHFDKIPAKVNDKILLFDPPEIDYIESHEGASNLYIQGDYFPCVFTLTELEERLRPFGFFRCHRSYIVNLQKVREVIMWTRNSYNLILDDQKKSSIPLSKAKMSQLKEMLGLK